MESISQTWDWVAILGITGTLLGGVLGSIITFLVQKYALEHQEKHRYQDRRLATYTEFYTATLQSVSAWACGRQDLEAMKSYLSAYSVVNLVGSEPIRAISVEIHSDFSCLMNTDESLTLEDIRVVSINKKLLRFQSQARKELGVERA